MASEASRRQMQFTRAGEQLVDHELVLRLAETDHDLAPERRGSAELAWAAERDARFERFHVGRLKDTEELEERVHLGASDHRGHTKAAGSLRVTVPERVPTGPAAAGRSEAAMTSSGAQVTLGRGLC